MLRGAHRSDSWSQRVLRAGPTMHGPDNTTDCYALLIGQEDVRPCCMASPTDDPRGPTDEEVGRKLAALRQVMGLDIPRLAARAHLDAETITAIEAGVHSATVDELSDLAHALGITITSIFRRFDQEDREEHQPR
jgi:DNA-binding XRE family transcriptional regulator